MTSADLLKRLRQAHAPAALAYGGAVIALIVVTFLTLSGLSDAYADYSAASVRLAALEGHGKSGGQSDEEEASRSPFLEGPTVTIAGADLQQRIVSAVTAVGGNVLSSQIDLQGSQAKEGYVVLTASCELSQSALQPLLYDIEAGMPFLFVEQLVVQAPQAGGDSEDKHMRIQIDVAGQWQVTK